MSKKNTANKGALIYKTPEISKQLISNMTVNTQ